MARFIVKRPFPDKMPIRTGQIVEDPQWKQLEYLLHRGYVEEVHGQQRSIGGLKVERRTAPPAQKTTPKEKR